MQNSHNIIIADDHPVLRLGLKAILEKDKAFSFSGEASDGYGLLDLLSRGVVPDALILDLSMPKMSGIETLRRIRQMNFSFKVLVLTMHKEPDVLCRAFSVGADGFMLKDVMAKELTDALHTLFDKRVYLSPAMARELPDTCLVKAIAGQRRPSPSLVHCGRNIDGSA
jgi:DNA-binding NarL/FixJ family response regulator